REDEEPQAHAGRFEVSLESPLSVRVIGPEHEQHRDEEEDRGNEEVERGGGGETPRPPPTLRATWPEPVRRRRPWAVGGGTRGCTRPRAPPRGAVPPGSAPRGRGAHGGPGTFRSGRTRPTARRCPPTGRPPGGAQRPPGR